LRGQLGAIESRILRGRKEGERKSASLKKNKNFPKLQQRNRKKRVATGFWLKGRQSEEKRRGKIQNFDLMH